MKKSIWLLFFVFCFLFLPKNTFALDSWQDAPDLMFHYTDNSFEASRLQMSPYKDFGTTTYGYNFSTNGARKGIGYYYNADDRYYNKLVDIDFVVFNSIRSDMLGVYTSFIRDDNQNITSCKVSAVNSLDFQKFYGVGDPSVSGGDTIEQIPSDVGIYSTVSCQNVYVNSGFDIVFSGPFESRGIFAISSLNVKVSPSSSLQSSIDKNTETQEEIKDKITDSDTSSSQDTAGSFFDDFKSDDYGLSDIITMPLTFIKGLSNASCYSLDLPLPFVEQNVQIPCMTSIYENYFGSFLTLYQTITTGFIAYWVCVNIYRLVKNFKNPDDDKVEVMEL